MTSSFETPGSDGGSSITTAMNHVTLDKDTGVPTSIRSHNIKMGLAAQRTWNGQPAATGMAPQTPRNNPCWSFTPSRTDSMPDISVIRALKTDGEEDFLLPAEPELMPSLEDAFRRKGPKRDNAQRGAQSMVAETSIRLILSVQLWLDIRTILETKAGNAFREMQRKARERIKEIDRFMLPDITYHDKQLRWRRVGRFEDAEGGMESFRLLKHEPVWAGLLLFRTRLVASHLGHALTGNSYIVMDQWLATAYTDESVFKRGLDPEEESDFAALLNNFVSFAPVFAAPGNPTYQEIQTACIKKEFAGRIGIREALYNRYAANRRDCYYFLQYLEELTIFSSKKKSPSLLQPVRSQDGKIPASWSRKGGDEPDLFPTFVGSSSLDEAAERELKRKALRKHLLPIQLLQLLDESLVTQLDPVLDLDYFTLFRESVEFLRCVAEQFRGLADGVADGSVIKVVGEKKSVRDTLVKGAEEALEGLELERKKKENELKKWKERDNSDYDGREYSHKEEDENYAGVVPPKVDVKLGKDTAWAMGWRETNFSVNVVGHADYQHLMRDKEYVKKLLSEK
ncbi:hypothetical protein B0H66DRAFT_643884 [Apodospora peruviana]|uniref:Uncharacterized protein n=1 Tax=Apodospora peruviana TaxID=516989 RepID=A0AAE0LYM2_9PEZI|nr:hypothetical protein B0H66DRAFT_643884 [Apodospora peruviana]